MKDVIKYRSDGSRLIIVDGMCWGSVTQALGHLRHGCGFTDSEAKEYIRFIKE